MTHDPGVPPQSEALAVLCAIRGSGLHVIGVVGFHGHPAAGCIPELLCNWIAPSVGDSSLFIVDVAERSATRRICMDMAGVQGSI